MEWVRDGVSGQNWLYNKTYTVSRGDANSHYLI
jgi:hypothetical protein